MAILLHELHNVSAVYKCPYTIYVNSKDFSLTNEY